MSRSGHRVFVNACGGSEESGHKIESWLWRPAGDNHASVRDRRQELEIGRHASHRGSGIDFHEIIEPILANVFQRYAEGFAKVGRWVNGFVGFKGKIEFDLVTFLLRGENAAQRLKADRLIGPGKPFLPQDVSGGQGCMSAQGHFQLWREPAEPEFIGLLRQERSLR